MIIKITSIRDIPPSPPVSHPLSSMPSLWVGDSHGSHSSTQRCHSRCHAQSACRQQHGEVLQEEE